MDFEFKLKDVVDLQPRLLDKVVEDFVEKECNIATFLFLKLAITKNITLREAYSRYQLVRTGDKEILKPFYYKVDNINGKFSFDCIIRLEERKEPIDIPNDLWNESVIAMILKLAKALKVEMENG